MQKGSDTPNHQIDSGALVDRSAIRQRVWIHGPGERCPEICESDTGLHCGQHRVYGQCAVHISNSGCFPVRTHERPHTQAQYDEYDEYASNVLCVLYVFRFKYESSVSDRNASVYLFSLAHITPGLLLVALTYLSTSPYMCVAVMALAYGFNGAVTQTSLSNSQDLSPNYSAFVLCIANTIGGLSGFVIPLVVAFFTKDNVIVRLYPWCVVVQSYVILIVIAEYCRGMAKCVLACFGRLHSVGIPVYVLRKRQRSAMEL